MTTTIHLERDLIRERKVKDMMIHSAPTTADKNGEYYYYLPIKKFSISPWYNSVYHHDIIKLR